MVEVNSSHSWVEIDQAQLIKNIAIIKSAIGDAQLAVVIKSNAYGHGIENIVPVLQATPEVDWAISFLLSEALRARGAGFGKPILVCGYVDGNISEAILNSIDLIVHDRIGLNRYIETAKILRQPVYVHVKVDTGMSRLGFGPGEAFQILQELQTVPEIVVRGLYSHFSESDALDPWYMQEQTKTFEELLLRLQLAGIKIPLVHLANTVGAFRLPTVSKNLVRSGGGIYGLLKSLPPASLPVSYWKLKPILSWKTRVMQVREIAANSYISYGRMFQAPTNMRIAVLPVGYADGYSRELSNSSVVSIHGKLMPIVGRICMNMMMIDVSNEVVNVGDEAYLLGNLDGVRITDLMKRLNTISCEIPTRINWTIPRVTI